MRFSRIGVFALLMATVLVGANCSYYNRVMSRKDLVDGSNAYKNRDFNEAERLFRAAVKRDSSGESLEGKMAQLFLARTLHSQFIGDRKNTAKAEDAIREYQKALALNQNDQSSYKAIASLYENLQKTDDWQNWVTKRSQNTAIPPEQRAEALTSLSAKKNSCANDISDTEQTKKTVSGEGGKKEFQFVKPAKAEDFETLKKCVVEGLELINQAIALETPLVKNAKSIDLKGASDAELKEKQDHLKVFESARSYKAILTIQDMRVAEMDGRTADRDRLKTESDAARANFLELSESVKKIQAELDERSAAREAEATRQPAAGVNANAANNKK